MALPLQYQACDVSQALSSQIETLRGCYEVCAYFKSSFVQFGWF
jgi:hypothetical protein